MPDIDVFYHQIVRRLVESGDWEQMRAMISTKLNESGWTDEMKHRSKEKARTMEAVSLQTLFEDMSPEAHRVLMQHIAARREIQTLIREYLEKEFE